MNNTQEKTDLIWMRNNRKLTYRYFIGRSFQELNQILTMDQILGAYCQRGT